MPDFNLVTAVPKTTISGSEKLPVADNGTAAALTTDLFATRSQGQKADSAVQPADLAPVATSGAYGDLVDAPVLAPVALSGAYADLVDPPALAAVATSGAYADLVGRPALGSLAGQEAAAVAITGGTITAQTLATEALTAGSLAVTGPVTLADGLEVAGEVQVATLSYALARFAVATAATAATHALDPAAGAVQTLTLTDNTLLTLPDPPAGVGYAVTLHLIQDATGDRLPTIQTQAGTPARWLGGSPPDWQRDPGAGDLVVLTHSGAALIAGHVGALLAEGS